jgi:hypothetical protein
MSVFSWLFRRVFCCNPPQLSLANSRLIASQACAMPDSDQLPTGTIISTTKLKLSLSGVRSAGAQERLLKRIVPNFKGVAPQRNEKLTSLFRKWDIQISFLGIVELGCIAAPAWTSIVPEIVSQEELRSAATPGGLQLSFRSGVASCWYEEVLRRIELGLFLSVTSVLNPSRAGVATTSFS